MATLDLTIGALEIGILLSTFLYGVATVQAYLYAERAIRDSPLLRTMVFFVWVLETIHTVFAWILLYSWTVTNYGIPTAMARAHWSLALSIPIASCVGATVQAFFAWRVRILGGRLIIPILSWSGSVLRLIFGTMLAILLIRTKMIMIFLLHYQWLMDLQLSLNTAVDLLNTSSLCYFLLRRRSAYKETRLAVQKLIVYTIETGLLTSLCALAVLACSLTMRNSFVYISIFMIYPKLFSNSLFTSLNARTTLRQRSSDAEPHGTRSNGVYFDTQLSDMASRSVALDPGQKSLPDDSRKDTISLSVPRFHLSSSFDNSSGKETLA